jgi:predicted nucleic acid-binding protein
MAEVDRPLPPLVYFDADVIISGCRSAAGASHILLRLAEYGLIRPLTSELALEEAERHIRQVSPSAVAAFAAAARSVFSAPAAAPNLAAVEEIKDQADPKDAPHLASALGHGARYLVTFNVRDYRPLADP